MRSWEAVIPPEAGSCMSWPAGGPIGWGARPALLVIDVTYEFVGTAASQSAAPCRPSR
jgi:hypothetical protein